MGLADSGGGGGEPHRVLQCRPPPRAQGAVSRGSGREEGEGWRNRLRGSREEERCEKTLATGLNHFEIGEGDGKYSEREKEIEIDR